MIRNRSLALVAAAVALGAGVYDIPVLRNHNSISDPFSMEGRSPLLRESRKFANSSDVTALGGNLSIAVKALASTIISNNFENNLILALLAARNGTKKDIEDVGDPDVSTVFSGAELSPAQIEEIEQCESYSPLLETVRQIDGKTMGMRDTSATLSAGTGATFSVTVTSGVITAVSVSGGGSGYAGSVPTLNVADSAGSNGQGAILVAVVSGGASASVTILSGGQGYTTPTITAQTAATAGERYGRAVFKWWHRQDTGEIAHDDIRRFQAMNMSAQDFRRKTGNLAQTAVKQVLTGHVKTVADMTWFGTPTTQTDNKWDQPAGIFAAVDDANTYGGLDRTLAANAHWKAKKDTGAHTWTAAQVIEDAMYTKGIADKGGHLDVLLVGRDLYPKYAGEARAYTQITDSNMAQLKLVGQYGFRGQVLKVNNTIIAYDWRMPKGYAVGMDLTTWVVAFKKGMKWAASEMYDQRKVKGGSDSDIFYLDTMYMPMCWVPSKNVKYTTLS
jgi:hypothetical protein